MVNNEIIKLKFDNSFNGRLFATQGDTGRVFNLQVFDDYNKPVDVTGMKLRMYVANSKEVSYSEGEIVEDVEGKIKVQVYNSQLKYPGKQKTQFILTDKDGQKIGSKIFDLWIEEGLEAGPTVGRNIYVDFEKINEALDLIKDYDKTLEEAKEVDASLKVGINEGIEARNNLADCKKKALEIKDQLDKSKVDANKTLDDLKTTKTESETLKSDLSLENQKATENFNGLNTKIEEGKTTTSELNTNIENAKTNKENLDKSNTTALATKNSLEDVTTTANSTKENLSNLKNQGDTLSGDLTAKIIDGNKLKSNLDASTSNAENAKSNLDASVETATSTNTNLKATDTEAKKTEALIKDLMSQLGKTQDEVKQIIASGDLSKYVTEPKLQEALKAYATKKDLSSIDVTGQLGDYAKKTEVPTKLSELTNDKAFKTESEIQAMINNSTKLKKEVVTSLPSSGVDDVVYLLKNKSESNNVCTEYLWINGSWEIIGDTKVDLTDYVKKREVKSIIKDVVKKEAIKPILKMTAVIDQANSNPLTCVTYEDDAKMMEKGSVAWDDFFETKLVLFKDGKEVRELQDSELNDLKPEDGDVMAKFKRMGLSIKNVEDKVYVTMTNDTDNPNFQYYAHTRGTSRREAFYLGAYLGFLDGNNLRSVTGKKPQENKSMTDFRNYAQANGSGYDLCGFYQLTFLQAMYVLKYGNLDSQTAIGRGLTSGGQSATNTTGTTNGKGIDYGTSSDAKQMRFQFIENLYGNRFWAIDGIVTGESCRFYTALDNFNDNRSGYFDTEINGIGSGGWTNKVYGTTELGFLPKELNGSTTIHYSDHSNVNSPCSMFFGGDSNRGRAAGSFCFRLYHGASDNQWYLSARLMFL
ncbi:MAG: BppU family phage baseplate upper protein [Peptoniphilus harei]|nr:BppU family phage baseplate upper protein [Peptoniphilus harei]